MKTFEPLTFTAVRAQLAAGHSLESLVREWWQRIEARGDDAVWIWRPQLEEVIASLPADPSLPLYGLTFAVKDNIDVAGWPTTAACPEFRYVATEDATVIARLRAAGAVPLGKTNMDQLALWERDLLMAFRTACRMRPSFPAAAVPVPEWP